MEESLPWRIARRLKRKDEYTVSKKKKKKKNFSALYPRETSHTRNFILRCDKELADSQIYYFLE